jgi:uncharacterized protein (DUF2126 family)
MVSGESLPRWGYSLYWRRDGQPVWRDARLIAGQPLPGEKDGEGQVTVETASNFLSATAKKLGVSPDYAMPVYEDAVEWIVREAQLPANTDPLSPEIDDPEARARFMRTFQRGLTKPIGHALPIQRWQSQNTAPRWMSEHWRLRRGVLYAVPGDSSLGYRLPLGSLPFVPAANYPYINPQDTAEEREPLPDFRAKLAERVAEQGAQASIASATPPPPQHRNEQAISNIEGTVRTAITVEPHNGPDGHYVSVFLPPVAYLEDYLDLIAAIEAVAEETGPRSGSRATPARRSASGGAEDHPDPGVVEVNIHPATSWREQVEITETLYQAAREVGLTADKFMVDGRAVGTGGATISCWAGLRCSIRPLSAVPIC